MRIVCYCENRNQIVHLGKLVPDLAAAGHAVTLLITPRVDTAGIRDEASLLECAVVEADDGLEAAIAEAARTGADTNRIVVCNRLAAQIAEPIFARAGLFLTFNDGTLKAAPLGRQARAMGLTTMTVQDGFHGFDPQPERVPDWYPEARRAALEAERVPDDLQEFVRTHIHLSQPFGKTHPDRCLVWGEAAAETMRLCHGVPASAIRVIGALTVDQRIFAQELRPRPADAEDFNVFYADQPMVAQSKMTMEDWAREFPEFLASLTPWNPMFKFHPSERQDKIEAVTAFFGPYMRLVEKPLIDDDVLADVDIMIGITSTTFLSAMALGRPVINYRMPGLYDRFPTIQSPLLCAVDTLADLRKTIRVFQASGTFLNNTEGRPLTYFIVPGDAKQAILEEVDAIAHARATEDRP